MGWKEDNGIEEIYPQGPVGDRSPMSQPRAIAEPWRCCPFGLILLPNGQEGRWRATPTYSRWPKRWAGQKSFARTYPPWQIWSERWATDFPLPLSNMWCATFQIVRRPGFSRL